MGFRTNSVTWLLISKRNWTGSKVSWHAYASRDSPPSHSKLDQKLDPRVPQASMKLKSGLRSPIAMKISPTIINADTSTACIIPIIQINTESTKSMWRTQFHEILESRRNSIFHIILHFIFEAYEYGVRGHPTYVSGISENNISEKPTCLKYCFFSVSD